MEPRNKNEVSALPNILGVTKGETTEKNRVFIVGQFLD